MLAGKVKVGTFLILIQFAKIQLACSAKIFSWGGVGDFLNVNFEFCKIMSLQKELSFVFKFFELIALLMKIKLPFQGPGIVLESDVALGTSSSAQELSLNHNRSVYIQVILSTIIKEKCTENFNLYSIIQGSELKGSWSKRKQLKSSTWDEIVAVRRLMLSNARESISVHRQ